MVSGRCMRCKDKREMAQVEAVKMANGRDAVKGVCAKCGCKMYKIGNLKDLEAKEAAEKKAA